jgi:DNA-binding PadR family transcriptional regulator
VVDAALLLLDERPMHGYELLTELTDRSAGRWQPSPGTIYPALNRMIDEGLVEAEEVDGKRCFSLTDAGRARLAEYRETHDGEAEAPWDDPGTGQRGDLRGRMAELVGQVRQIGRFGSAEQSQQAAAVLDDARRKLYAILAAEATVEPGTGPDGERDEPA